MRERPYHRLRHRHHQQQLFGGALWRDMAGAAMGMVIEAGTSIVASAGWKNLKGGLKRGDLDAEIL